MTIKVTNKDITTVNSGIIAHGVNCQGAMGAGVAKALYEKWPMIRQQYIQVHPDDRILGRVQRVIATPMVLVYNCFTQWGYGSKGRYADPTAISTCLNTVMRDASRNRYNEIFIPPIGCGLGGLDYEKDLLPVLKELDETYKRVDITVCDIDFGNNDKKPF